MAKQARKIDNLKDAKAALRKAEAALAAAIGSKKKLADQQQQRIAELAHEIKTPLTAMMGFAEIMKDQRLGPIGNEAYVDHAKTVYSAAQHILGVCNTVLAANPADEDSAEIEKREVDVRALIAEVVAVFKEMARERGVELRARIPTAFPKVQTDPVRLQQVLFNIISNAVKFTPSGGRVSVNGRVDPRDGALIVIIRDQGRGMTDSQIEKMLKPYKHDPNASPHGDAGFGLGLPVASSMMGTLGGRLELRSVLNVGSIVTLKLPG
jgi:two-component system, cell cycle sensor histidine kinase PleC